MADKIWDTVAPVWQKAFDEKAAKEAAEEKAAKESRKESGKAAVKGMKEGRMDAMGNAYKKGGYVKAADGCATKGKTKGRFV
jgi:hypothetical protein